MKNAFGIEISKGLPSALRGGRGERMAERALQPYEKKAVKAAKGLKKPKAPYKQGRKMMGFVSDVAGKRNAYLMSRVQRNEEGRVAGRMMAYKKRTGHDYFKRAKPQDRMDAGRGMRDWERSKGF